MKSNTKTVGKRKSRRPRTQMHLTMINMFLNVIATRSVLVNDTISLSYVLMLSMGIVRLQNDKAISEFYRSRIFQGDVILMKTLEKL